MTTQNSESAMPTNENQPTVGVMNVYPNPSGRMDPMENNERYPEFYSSAVKRETKEDRHNMLRRIFDSTGPASEQARAEIAQLLHHGASGDYESHAPLLQMGKEASSEQEPSLGDLVQQRFGRF